MYSYVRWLKDDGVRLAADGENAREVRGAQGRGGVCDGQLGFYTGSR